MVIFLLLALGSAVPILLYRDWALNRVIWFFVWIALDATGILAHCGRHYAVAQRRTPLKLWTGVCVSACGRLTFRLARRSVYEAR